YCCCICVCSSDVQFVAAICAHSLGRTRHCEWLHSKTVGGVRTSFGDVGRIPAFSHSSSAVATRLSDQPIYKSVLDHLHRNPRIPICSHSTCSSDGSRHSCSFKPCH